MSTTSKKITLTLPIAQYDELEQIATTRNLTIPRVVLERLEEWHSTSIAVPSSEPISLKPLIEQCHQISESIRDLQTAIEELHDRPPASLSDPQVRTLLQPIQNRLQQQETQMGVLGNLIQQILPQMLKNQVRVEIWLEALYRMCKQLLLDGYPEDFQKLREEWFETLWQEVQRILKEQE